MVPAHPKRGPRVLNLKNSFKYQGDAKQSPFSHVQLAASFPQFDYLRGDPADARVTRKLRSVDRVEAEQDLGTDHYRITGATADLIGADTVNTRNFLSYTAAAAFASSLGDLSFTIPVQFVAGATSLGATAFQAL